MNVVYNNFDSWYQSVKHPFASGRSEKLWLMRETAILTPRSTEVGLFKYPKNEFTYEHVSEHMASQIGKIIGVDCAKVDLGIYNNRKGSFSYLVTESEEVLCEGIVLMQLQYKNYDSNTLTDKTTGAKYSIEMIINSLINNTARLEFMQVPIFDFFIGNSDRHHSNWAVIINPKDFNIRLSPLYDNGSSLCAYVPDKDISLYLKDKNRFNALVSTKSKSCIYLNGTSKPQHSKVIEYLLTNNYISRERCFQMTNNLESKLDRLITSYSDVISPQREQLIHDFLSSKISIIKEIIEKESEQYGR